MTSLSTRFTATTMPFTQGGGGFHQNASAYADSFICFMVAACVGNWMQADVQVKALQGGKKMHKAGIHNH